MYINGEMCVYSMCLCMYVLYLRCSTFPHLAGRLSMHLHDYVCKRVVVHLYTHIMAIYLSSYMCKYAWMYVSVTELAQICICSRSSSFFCRHAA